MLSTKEKLEMLTEAGISGCAIARLTGISQPTISRIATGKSTPKEPAVIAIDKVFRDVIKPRRGAKAG